jgi:hypothetical protein
MDTNRTRRLPALITLAGGLLLASLLSIHIGAPWRYIHDDNGSWTQAVASARLRAGWGPTLGQDFFARRPDGALTPYLHHPPLYGSLAAISYRITGDASPLATRVMPALFHLLGYLGFAVLIRALFGRDLPRMAVALLLYAVVPMSSYFGKMPFNEPVGLCWVMWALVFLARHRRSPSRRDLTISLAFWALAGLTSWTAYVILAAHALVETLERMIPRESSSRAEGAAVSAAVRRLRPALHVPAALLATGLVTGAFVMLHLLAAGGWQSPRLLQAADHWGTQSLSLAEIPERLAKAADLHRLYFANLPFLLYLLWVAWRARELWTARRPRANLRALSAIVPERRFLLAGSLGALGWALLFLRPISFHAYGQFWYLPYECLAVADVAAVLWRRWAYRPRWRAAAAALALAGTVASAGQFLHYRYSKFSDYAIRQSAITESRYFTSPWE